MGRRFGGGRLHARGCRRRALGAVRRGGRTGGGRRRDVHPGRAADPAARLPAVPPSRLGGPDVAADLPGGSAVGAGHPGQDRAARDAPRGSSSATSGCGGSRRTRRCPTRRSRPSAAGVDAGRAAREPGRRPRPDRARVAGGVAHRHSGVDRRAARAGGGRRRRRRPLARHLGRLAVDGRPLHQGGRDQAVSRRAPGRAPRGHVHALGGGGRRGGRRLPQRVRDGEERRHLSRRHRPPHPGGDPDSLQHALQLGGGRRSSTAPGSASSSIPRAMCPTGC